LFSIDDVLRKVGSIQFFGLNILADKVVLTVNASAELSVETQPLSTVESAHAPFDLWRYQ
jgi:hypothetical protein